MASHEELIKSGSFNAKFKNALRDYYSYGFMNYGQISASTSKAANKKASATTLNEDWTRLTNILGGYFSWSADKSASLFACTDSRRLSENPFHRVYRFCRYNSHDPIFFFNTIFALNPKVKLTDGIDSLELINDYSDNFIKLDDDIKAKKPLTSSQLQCFFSENKEQLFGGDNNTVNAKLKELEKMGLVTDEGEKTGSKRINHRWKLSELFLRDIFEKGTTADPDFAEHFTAAIEFFSKYYILGEIGTYILSRLNDPHKYLFRVKHEYFAQALNDYNLLDFLYAIEHKKWCKISYRNSVNGVETAIICYPLQIRISSVSGREYVTFYEPFKRNYSHLRLEFVDSVDFIKDGSILDGETGRTVSSEDETVQKDIEKVLTLIGKTWGAAGPNIKSLEEEPKISKVSFDAAFNLETEYYIPARLEREKRIGQTTTNKDSIHFTAEVLNSGEMLPWIRSFYTRLLNYSDSEGFSVENDVDRILEQNEAEKPQLEKLPKKAAHIWSIPDSCTYKIEKKPAYSLLFNEIFGIYYHIMGEVLVRIFSHNCSEKKDTYFSGDELDNIISDVLKNHKEEMGIWTEANLRKEIKELFKSDFPHFMRKGIVPNGTAVRGSKEEEIWVKTLPNWLKEKEVKRKEGFRPKFSTSCLSFGSDICPLTDIEAKWLITILQDNKIKLFLNQKEIMAIQNAVFSKKAKKENITPFKTDKIVYFDRYCRNSDIEKEGKILRTAIKAMNGSKTVKIRYLSLRGKTISDEFIPLAIEYSKRDDVFRMFFKPYGEHGVFTMVLSNVEEIVITDNNYDFDKAQKDFDIYLSEKTESVTVEFYNQRNLADRILSELSPCEKTCSYDSESELYTLKVFYQKYDELEMVIRLMGYGWEILIKDTEHPIYREIRKRLMLQKAICEKEKQET